MISEMTKGIEVPNTTDMAFVFRKDVSINGRPYEIVVKASKIPFFAPAGIHMYSLTQVIDHNKKEVFHEFYPAILSEKQAKIIIKNIKRNPNDFVK